MNTISSANKIKAPKNNSGLIGLITQYDSLVVFGGFGSLIFLTVLYTGLFQAGPMVRESVVFNAALGILMAFAFIYIIFKFIGEKIVVFGKSFDVGMVVYIAIVLFVIFIFGN